MNIATLFPVAMTTLFLDIHEFTFGLKKICKYINNDDIKIQCEIQYLNGIYFVYQLIPHNVTEKIELYIVIKSRVMGNVNGNNIHQQQSESEMFCGWSKLEIHNTNINRSNGGINRNHKLQIYGGTFNNESNVNSNDIRNNTNCQTNGVYRFRCLEFSPICC